MAMFQQLSDFGADWEKPQAAVRGSFAKIGRKGLKLAGGGERMTKSSYIIEVAA
jgi:hypothetical protein